MGKQREKAKASKDDVAATSGGRKPRKHTFFWPVLLGIAALAICIALAWDPRSLRVVEVERVALDAMTSERFLEDYANQRPVVITQAWKEDGWNVEELASACPDARVRTFEHDSKSKVWGGLVQVGTENLQDYVALHLARNPSERPRPRLYGFEIALKFHCPRQLEAFTVPSFLTEDAFHLATNKTGLGWPSVLVGPDGTQTGLHIDTHRLPFWIAVVGEQNRGLKRFRLFPHNDSGLLKYGRPTEKANFIFDYDPWKPDFKRFPGVADSFAYETELRSGDLLYIPGGSPHAVINLADNVGISMNYLDLKSFPDFVRKASAGSPLYHVLKGAGAGILEALQERQKSEKAMTYFEFAGLRDRDHFCEVHRATKDEGERPAGLAAYCDV